MGIPSDGKGCPNEGGVFSGSAAVIKGMPTIVYPGVHNVAKDSAHPDGIGMAQCLARPANISDKYLRHWRSQIIVPTYPPPGDVNNHYHDDAQVWLSASDNRYYTFASGGNMRRTRGVNLLYSCAAQDFETRGGPWRYEHPLWNISDGSCNFVSCPEMYSLPGIPDGTPMQSGPVVYESLCGGDKYWLGHYDDHTHTFTPDPSYYPRNASASASASASNNHVRHVYDYGVGHASKSFWHSASGRRIMWSWISGASRKGLWDSMQSVPRVITLDRQLNRLRVNPVEEITQLRTTKQPRVVFNSSLPPEDGMGIIPLGTMGPQADFNVTFKFPKEIGNVTLHLMSYKSIISVSGGDRDRDRGGISGSVSSGIDVSVRGGGGGGGGSDNWRYMPNTNLPGGDQPGADFVLASNHSWSDKAGSQECIDFCNRHSFCTGWTYVKTPKPRCAIKGQAQVEPPKPDTNCISGYKRPHDFKWPATVSVKCLGSLSCDISMSLTPVTNGTVTLRILVDRSVVEVYDGVSAMSVPYNGPADAVLPDNNMRLSVEAPQGLEHAGIYMWDMGSAYAS